MTINAPNATSARADLTRTVGGGGGLTDPNTIAGLVLWLDAADAASITASGSPAKVSQWNNKKTSATVHAVQATGGNQPTTGTRTQNSKNVLDFDAGSFDYMSVNAINNLSDNQTIFAVLLSDVGTSGNLGWFSAFNTGANDYDNAGSWVCHATATGFLTYNAATNRYANTATTTAANQITATYASGGQCTLYVNGSSASGTHSANGVAGLNCTDMTIGSRWYSSSTNAYWDGWIAEIIYYDTVLGSTDRTAVQTYLKTKWGTP